MNWQGSFKMVTSDLITVRMQVLKHMYILTEIKMELVRFGVNGNHKRHIIDPKKLSLAPILAKDPVAKPAQHPRLYSNVTNLT